MNSRLTRWACGIALAVALTVVAGSAFAQQPGGVPTQPGGGGAPGGGRGGRGGGGGGGGFDWGQMAQRAGNMQPASVCASGDYLYIVRGNTLYQFEVKGLKLVKKTHLEEETPNPMPMPMPRGDGAQPSVIRPQGDQPPPPPAP